MGEFAQQFYHTQAWRKCRDAYAKSVGGLCERCRAKGLIVAGREVHHKTHLTPDNINDESITLNWANLELLCHSCHEKEHRHTSVRYNVDACGRVTVDR